MSTARVHARNLLANWTGQAASIVVMFFLSPFVVHTLGKSQYGLWSLLVVLTGYMGLFDLGVRASTGRYVILYYGRGDHARLDETLRTGLGLFSLGGVLILLAAVVIGLAFPMVFPSAPAEYQHLTMLLLPVLAVNVWLSILGALFSSVLAAHDRFDLMQATGIVSLAIRAAGTVFVLKSGYGICGLTAMALTDGLISAFGNAWLARRIYPQLRVWPLMLSRERLREMFGYGVPAFLSSIAGRVIAQSATILVGALIAVSAVTDYSIGAMLPFYAAPFLYQIGCTLFPAVQRAAARNDLDSMRWLFVRQVQMALLFAVLVYIGFIAFGEAFLRIWMGPGFAGAFTVLVILSITELVASTLIYAGMQLLNATGRLWFQVAGLACEGVISVSLGVFFVLVLDWGVAGVAAGALTGRLFDIAITWYACRVAAIRWQVLKGVLLRGVLAAVSFAAWCFVVRTMIVAEAWSSFFLQVGLAVAGYVPLALALLVPQADRARLYRLLHTLAWQRAGRSAEADPVQPSDLGIAGSGLGGEEK